MDSRPFAWIGRRSYGIYLWHWPILVVTRPGFDVQGPEWLIDIARAGLVLVIAGLSYRYLETPIRERGLAAWFRAVRVHLAAASRRLASAVRGPADGAPATRTAPSPTRRPAPVGATATATAARRAPSGVPAAGAFRRRLAPGVAGTALFATVCAAVLVTAGFATPHTDDAAAEPVPATPLPVASPAPSSAPILTFPSSTEIAPVSPSPSAPGRLETTSTVTSQSTTTATATPSSPEPTAGSSSPAAPVSVSTASPPMTEPSDDAPPARTTEPATPTSTAPATAPATSTPPKKPVAKPPATTTTSAAPPQATTAPATKPPATTPTTKPAATTTAAPPKAPPAAVSAFGDSVLLGAAPAVKAVTGSLSVDAVVGRQAWDTLEAVVAAKKAKALAPVVLIHTGNNGVISPKQLAATLEALKDRTRVVLVNDHVDRSWQGPNNKTIAAVGAGYPNVAVVDWNAAAAKNPAWFGPDGIHVNSAGAKAYAALIAQALG